jgi:S-adenosylmethionine:tRNA ribosyltransferase-isomerase
MSASMQSAVAPRERRSDARLLVIDTASGQWIDRRAADLGSMLRPSDLLVVNDAATLPASLSGRVVQGEELELRLLGPAEGERFSGVLFGAGSWRTKTEHRAPPPRLTPGARLQFGPELSAEVRAVSALSPRLIEVRFDQKEEALWAALYAHGRPIQYAYLSEELDLWSVQTVYGGRPWAAEMPSAGRPLSWEILLTLRQKGVEVCWLTHAAGLSSTGDPELDRALPLPERYDIPESTVAAIARARQNGGRVFAVGTTVARALEGAERNARQKGAAPGSLFPGSAFTDLVLDENTQPAVISGLITGMHGPGESHFRLMSALAPPQLLAAAWQHAAQSGYLAHEFGDLCLLFAP